MVAVFTLPGLRRRRRTPAAILTGALIAAGALYWLLSPPTRGDPVVASGSAVTTLLDFTAPMPLDPPPAGWWHRTFWTRTPMHIAFEQRSGRMGLICRTHGSASIFGRFTDISIDAYPVLAWTWRVDEPVRTPRDERLREGDDHPIRLFLRFQTKTGMRRAMEIIWSNGAYSEGQFKYIGAFPHYVAQTGTDELGMWVDEEINLAAIYRSIWHADDAPRLSFIGLFCDTDDTNVRSEAALRQVVLKRSAAD